MIFLWLWTWAMSQLWSGDQWAVKKGSGTTAPLDSTQISFSSQLEALRPKYNHLDFTTLSEFNNITSSLQTLFNASCSCAPWTLAVHFKCRNEVVVSSVLIVLLNAASHCFLLTYFVFLFKNTHPLSLNRCRQSCTPCGRPKSEPRCPPGRCTTSGTVATTTGCWLASWRIL